MMKPGRKAPTDERLAKLQRAKEVLEKSNASMVRAEDKERLFQEACGIAVEQGGFAMAWVGVPEERSGSLRPVASAGHEDGYLSAIEVSATDSPAGRGPGGRAFREGRHFVCNDIENARYMAPWRGEAVKRGYLSSAAFPLTVGGRTVAVLNLYAGERDFFDDDVVAVFDSLAGDFSFALGSLEHEERLLRAERELRRRAEDLEITVRDKTRELMASQEILSKAERLALIGSMSTQVAHDLRNPLTAINTAAYCLEESLPPDEGKRLRPLLEALRSSVRHADSILEDLVELSQPFQGGKSSLEVSQLAREAVRQAGPPDGVEVSWRLEPRALVKGNDRKLVRALRNCVSNAVDAMPRGGRLTISSAAEGGKVVISISDTGEGIPEDNLKMLFTPFFSTKAKGLGVGLAIAKGIVEAHGGTIEAASKEGRGTKVTIALPLAARREEEPRVA